MSQQQQLDCRSPKPELLQLLFQYLPLAAQKASNPSKNGHKNGHSHGHTTSANGQSDGINGGEHLNDGQNGSSNGNEVVASGHSHASSSDSDDSECNAGADTQQPKVQVDGQANGISKDTAHQQATELQQILQDEVEAYLDKRHIIDILHDFSGSHPPLASLLSCLRPLQPRLYSISSSQLEQARRVQITVAVVRYKALGRERIGVTSTFLKERMQVCTFCYATLVCPVALLINTLVEGWTFTGSADCTAMPRKVAGGRD